MKKLLGLFIFLVLVVSTGLSTISVGADTKPVDKDLVVVHRYPTLTFAGETTYSSMSFTFELDGDIIVVDSDGNKLLISAYKNKPVITQDKDLVIQDFGELQIIYDFSRDDNRVKITYKGDYKGLIQIPVTVETSKTEISSSELKSSAYEVGTFDADGKLSKGLSYDWSDAKGVVSVKDNKIEFTTNGIFNIDPSIVGTATAGDCIGNAQHRSTFYADGRHWVFYGDGTNWGYRSSADGTTWGNFTAIHAATSSAYVGTIFYDGTYLHYGLGGGESDIFYRRGDPQSDGTITWSAVEQTAKTGTYQTYSICVNASGYPFIAVFNSSTSRVEAWWSSKNDGTWTTASGCPVVPVANNGELGQIVPTTNGNVLIIQARGQNNEFYSSKYDSSTNTWAAAVQINDDSAKRAQGTRLSATSYNGIVYLTWANNAYDIYVDQYDGTNWGTDTLVYATALATIMPVISVTNAAGDLRIFWTGTPTANHIYYKNRVSGTWDVDPTDWITETALSTGWQLSVLVAYERLNYITGAVYVNGSANPFDVKYAYLDDTPAPSNVYLTTSSGSGGNVTTPGESTYAYNISEVVNISATADACYHFVNWTGNTSDIGNVNSASTNISMGSVNKSATANFVINTSTITYSAGANGTINNSIPQTINCGTNTTYVLASPNACYKFVNWNDSSTMNPRSDVGTSTNQSFLANFAINTSTITYVNGSGGGITGSLSQTIDCGNYTTAVTAVSNACYAFVNWSDANTSVSRADLGTSTNQSFTANFAINTSVITYSAGAGGSVNGSWPENVNCGDNSSWVEATPDPCYYFVNWSDSSTDNPRQDTNVTSNISVTANFAIDTYTLSLSGTGGVPYFDGSSPFNCNDSVNIYANASSCYTFENWSPTDGVTDPNSSDTTVLMDQNRSITSNYIIKTYNLSTGTPVNGNISLPGNAFSGTYNCSETVPLEATPSPGYGFMSWTGDTSGVVDIYSSNTTVGMGGNYSINASFGLFSVLPPTDIKFSVDKTGELLNINWTPGGNTTGTIIVMCSGGYCPCGTTDFGSLGYNCSLVYTGSGNSTIISGTNMWSPGYYFTFWGTAYGSQSVNCTQVRYTEGSMIIFLLIALIVLALGLTWLATKVNMILFRIAPVLAWTALGIWLLLGDIPNLGISDPWTQVVGFVFIIMAIAVGLMQMKSDIHHEKTFKDKRGGSHSESYTDWGSKRKNKKPSSADRQAEYRMQVRGTVQRGRERRRG